jgi:hypothetical protein
MAANGKYNKAITVTMNGQNVEMKPISCGLLHVPRKDKKTGETTISDNITVMFLDQYDGSFILTINFKSQKLTTGSFPSAEQKRPMMESDQSLSDGHPDKYVFPRPHVSGSYYPNKKNPENRYQGSMYNMVFDQGSLELTRLDLVAHRVSFTYSGTVTPWRKSDGSITIKGLEIKDIPLAEMDTNDMGMPKKVIYQEKF